MNQSSIIHTLAICMAIVPPMFSKHFGVCSLHKFYVYFLSSVVIGTLVFLVYQLFSVEFYAGDTVHFIIYFVTVIISFIKNMISVLRVSIFKADLYRKFHKRILNIEAVGQVKCWNFNTQFIMLNVFLTICVVVIIVQDFKGSSTGFLSTTMFWFEFNHYFDTTLVLIIYYYMNNFKFLFRHINRNLVKNINKYKRLNTKNVFWSVNRLRKRYANLTDATDIFNVLFGWQILFIYMTISVTIINFLDIAIKYILETEKRDHYYKIFNLEIFFTTLLIWSLIFWVTGAAIATTSEMATKEAKRTAILCYNLLLDIPGISVNNFDRMLRQELILLTHQATHHHPYFSAAGFFNIDYRMIFSLLGTMTAYIVVLLQINK